METTIQQVLENVNNLSPDTINCIKWSAFFGMLHFGLPRFLLSVYPEWWNGLTERKKYDLTSTMIGMIHHFVVVVTGFLLFYWNYTSGYILSPSELAIISPFVYGYLIGDTLFFTTYEAMNGRYEYLIHHVVGIFLVGGALNAKNPKLLLFVPHMLITELSTFLFGAGFVLRSTQYKDWAIVNQLELAFCVIFTITRIFNMPRAIYECWDEMDELGYVKYNFIPIVGIQFFWFYKICTGVWDKYIMKNEKKKKST